MVWWWGLAITQAAAGFLIERLSCPLSRAGDDGADKVTVPHRQAKTTVKRGRAKQQTALSAAVPNNPGQNACLVSAFFSSRRQFLIKSGNGKEQGGEKGNVTGTRRLPVRSLPESKPSPYPTHFPPSVKFQGAIARGVFLTAHQLIFITTPVIVMSSVETVGYMDVCSPVHTFTFPPGSHNTGKTNHHHLCRATTKTSIRLNIHGPGKSLFIAVPPTRKPLRPSPLSTQRLDRFFLLLIFETARGTAARPARFSSPITEHREDVWQ
ncbi:hypothetical protein L249_0041 [Ophiocordyceps polyrhachis-furcata BCC 54312]|uniref:Secreted protein n=1 Tax=Ophiocordyceps polyrhachis-furcata BCC 54312 TaxID=1330021 RepID=A0A367LD86_9HYPO|nr:hypothetical protein L249_0041 [Ophiocordyceps polyrhachis-furcata BCC 54312]